MLCLGIEPVAADRSTDQWRPPQMIKMELNTLPNKSMKGGSPGLVVMGGDSRSEGRGFESQCHILDGHDIFSH